MEADFFQYVYRVTWQLQQPDMEVGHWINGSMGHLGHLSRPGHRVTGSSFDPVWDSSFFGFRKNAQNAKRTFEMLKWHKSLSGVCCWTEITGCQSMQWTFPFTYDYQNFWPENTSSHISPHLEFIIQQGHWVNWVSRSLDSRSLGRWVTKCDPVPCLAATITTTTATA